MEAPPRWMPPDEDITVNGFVISGGMIHTSVPGAGLMSYDQTSECIDPSLPVVYNPREFDQRIHPPYSYHGLSPVCRGTYLAWLAGGRWAQDAQIGYVFLYLHGLERRAIVDAKSSSTARAELPLIDAEVARLLVIYGHDRSFRRAAMELRGYLATRLVISQDVTTLSPPDPAAMGTYPFMALRIALGRFAARDHRLPAAWVYSWALSRPGIEVPTALRICPDDFRRLFLKRLNNRYPSGIPVTPTRIPTDFRYQPANPSLAAVRVDLGQTDVTTDAETIGVVTGLVEECARDLDPYARLISREPTSSTTLAALAVLPDELIADDHPVVIAARALVTRHLGSDTGPVVIDADELRAFGAFHATDRMSKPDAMAVAQLLGRFGIGMEPDVRLGGPTPGNGPVVLFRAVHPQAATASAEYAAAAALLHLAAAVADADGEISESEQAHLAEQVVATPDLSDGERERLSAHVAWLSAGNIELDRITTRLANLTTSARAQVGELLVATVVADGEIHPNEIITLRGIYTLLGLDPDSLYARFRPPSTTTTDTDPDRTLNLFVESPPDLVDTETTDDRPLEVGGTVLDNRAIADKHAEATALAALLSSVFADDEEIPPPPIPDIDETEPVSGLDTEHSAFVHRLGERSVWSRADMTALCAELGLIIEGAIDTVNEAAIDAVGEFLIEDHVTSGNPDGLQIDHDIRKELLV